MIMMKLGRGLSFGVAAVIALISCNSSNNNGAFVVVNAVLYGDEIYQDAPGGKFWAFYTEGIAIIDPESCTIETTITKDHNGDTLPISWNDGVYMQNTAVGGNNEGYVMIGSRVDETNALGDVISHAYAISTTDRKVVAKTEVG
ncbi:MAG: hypothetical protein ACI8RD_004672 [Bacillariaceae sp.]|jgi:hypothetical protein